MTLAAVAPRLHGPHVDWLALSPIVALSAGALVALLAGLIRTEIVRTRIVPMISLITLGTTVGFAIDRLPHPRGSVVAGALAMDGLANVLILIFCVAGLAAVLLSWRASAANEAGHGEYHALLLFSVLGMAVLVAAQNLITLFLGFELLSIPLYILCAAEARRENSLESGLKYLVVGSVGSATLVYGFAMVYGATGSTFFSGIAHAIGSGGILDDPLLMTGLALVMAGFAFKASVAPFHQWTPDVYEGAPTPVTAFMATATKAAALGVLLRFFDVAAIGEQAQWGPILAALAATTIVVGNVGALGQSSLKRLLAFSGVAQAGYMLAGVVVATRLGVRATVFYLAVYLVMNIAAFAAIVFREREEPVAVPGAGAGGGVVAPGVAGDDISALGGLSRSAPALAVGLTVAMLALAGIPGTAGFVGKLELIRALVDGGYAWLAIVLVIGSMLSLGYYLRVVAAVWMRGSGDRRTGVPAVPGGAGPAVAGLPAIAGGSPELDRPGEGAIEGDAPSRPAGVPVAVADHTGEVGAIAILFTLATVGFGILPEPLFRLVAHAGDALPGLF